MGASYKITISRTERQTSNLTRKETESGIRMIYVTGDTHGDIERFKKGAVKKLKKGDTLIVCGDFGFVWDGSKKEQKNLKWLTKRKYTVCFCDGGYDSHPLLEKYPDEPAFGDTAKRVGKNIFYLTRGGVYEIEGKKFFVMGSGDNPAIPETSPNYGYLLPTAAQKARAMGSLERNGFSVDYVITHRPPLRIGDFLSLNGDPLRLTDMFLDDILEKLTFKKWFFGFCHLDKPVGSKFTAVYKHVVPVS